MGNTFESHQFKRTNDNDITQMNILRYSFRKMILKKQKNNEGLCKVYVEVTVYKRRVNAKFDSDRVIRRYTCITGGGYIFEPHSTTTPAGNSVLNLVDNNFTVPIEQITSSNYTGVSRKLDAARCAGYSYITYDIPGSGSPATQTYLYGQVTKTENENATTWYSYDESGQLVWMKQNIMGLGIKTIDYTYDYFGNVTQVAYQAGQTDKFYHHYDYDINQRLTNVYTSFDGTNKTLQAKYIYYLHGPLKRVELAGNLQGMDYVYTINGALKSINHSDVTKDPGADGPGNGFSADVYGQTFNYYDSDYSGAGYSAGAVTATGITNQYNGMIKALSWFTPVDNPSTKKVYGYTYDNLNQLQNAQFGSLTGTAGTYAATFSGVEAYREGGLAYDKNGNIQSLLRKGKTGNSLANYGYVYESNTNRLDKVNHNSAVLTDYAYNAIGQMTQQVEGANTMNVTYNAYGLIKEVRDASNNLMVSYAYDDRGERIKKTAYTSGTASKNTFYVSDATGNTLAIYEQTLPGGAVQLTEVPVYGAGRVAMYKPVPNAWFYELTDHLGNVRAVIGPPHTDIYTATMESEVATAEDAQFKNIAPRVAWVNGTVTPPAIAGNEAVRLNSTRPAGPGISLKVSPGDVITAEVYAYYEGCTDCSNTLPLATIVNAVAAAFGGVSGAPGDPGKIYNGLSGTLNGGFAGAAGSGNNALPAAYLNLITFNNNLDVPVPTELPMSAIPITSAANMQKQKLTIGPITIPSPGYVYIYVNNNSNSSTLVYFDDLKVTHLHSPFVAGADYYPFGLAMSDREITTEPYRYGYQGQYSEENETTGWNEFQLRMYDPKYGRWNSTDPYRQYASGYVGMGNNPVSNVDPDGGFSTTLLNEVVVTASRLPSIASIVGSVAGSVGSSLLNNAISSSFNPLDDVHYNTQTQKTTIKTTDDNYDKLYVDGKHIGNSGQGGWKTYAPDAQVFGEYSFGFYNAAYGSLLRNDNVFARLYKGAPSQAAQGNLFKASISNRDPTILYATLATPVAIIGAGELLGAAAAFDGAAYLNTGNWWRLGKGWNPATKSINTRLAWGAHSRYLPQVPKVLRPLNKWLRELGGGHIHFP